MQEKPTATMEQSIHPARRISPRHAGLMLPGLSRPGAGAWSAIVGHKEPAAENRRQLGGRGLDHCLNRGEGQDGKDTEAGHPPTSAAGVDVGRPVAREPFIRTALKRSEEQPTNNGPRLYGELRGTRKVKRTQLKQSSRQQSVSSVASSVHFTSRLLASQSSAWHGTEKQRLRHCQLAVEKLGMAALSSSHHSIRRLEEAKAQAQAEVHSNKPIRRFLKNKTKMEQLKDDPACTNPSNTGARGFPQLGAAAGQLSLPLSLSLAEQGIISMASELAGAVPHGQLT
ncbi:hypothetical protein AOLI_G00220050 [Acnodon oligacanthus]